MVESASRAPSAKSISGIEISPSMRIEVSNGDHTSKPAIATARPAKVAMTDGTRHTFQMRTR